MKKLNTRQVANSGSRPVEKQVEVKSGLSTADVILTGPRYGPSSNFKFYEWIQSGEKTFNYLDEERNEGVIHTVDILNQLLTPKRRVF